MSERKRGCLTHPTLPQRGCMDCAAAASELVSPTGSSCLYYEKAKRELKHAMIREHPEILDELIARHYLSLVAIAVDMKVAVEMKRHGAQNTDELIGYCRRKLREQYIEDFGDEPSWMDGKPQ